MKIGFYERERERERVHMNVLWEEFILPKNLIKTCMWHPTHLLMLGNWELGNVPIHGSHVFIYLFILGVLILINIVVVNLFGILFIFGYFEFVNIWVCARFTDDIKLGLCSCCTCSS